MSHTVIDDLLQVAYRLRVRLEPSPGRDAVWVSSSLDNDTDHRFEGGVKHDVFLRFPDPDRQSIKIALGDNVEIEAVVFCWSYQPAIDVGSKWITYRGHEGSVAVWRVLEVLQVWEERTGLPYPVTDNWGRHSKV